jgi:hypothetical protein
MKDEIKDIKDVMKKNETKLAELAQKASKGGGGENSEQLANKLREQNEQLEAAVIDLLLGITAQRRAIRNLDDQGGVTLPTFERSTPMDDMLCCF